jgi:hypothetical protein
MKRQFFTVISVTSTLWNTAIIVTFIMSFSRAFHFLFNTMSTNSRLDRSLLTELFWIA